MKKYYLAYDERYRTIHRKGLLWFSSRPSPELVQWLRYYNVPAGAHLCDVGCGEGRDALYAASLGYKVTALDISPQAIAKCRDLSQARGLHVNWRIGDALELDRWLGQRFTWVYSVATLHMLTETRDRQQFLRALWSVLEPGGKLLLVNKGDGHSQSCTDPAQAFEEQERRHQFTNTPVRIVSTTYRAVDWTTHRAELEQAGLTVERTLSTASEDYQRSMTVYLTRIN